MCSAGAEALDVGTYNGATLMPFSPTVTLIYGPQGGQHFYADGALSVAESGDYLLVFDFTDATTGANAGHDQRSLHACSCPARFDNIPVFLNTDTELTGVLDVHANAPSGRQIHAAPVTIAIRRP